MKQNNTYFLKSRWGSRHIVYGIALGFPTLLIIAAINKFILHEIVNGEIVNLITYVICFIRGVLLSMCRFYFFEDYIEMRFFSFKLRTIYIKDINYIEFLFGIKGEGDYLRIYTTKEERWIQRRINRLLYVVELKGSDFNVKGQYYKLFSYYYEKNVKIKIERFYLYGIDGTEKNDLNRIFKLDKDNFLVKKE
jgi:hypothetical protein